MNILVLNYEYPPVGGGAAPVCQDLCEHFVSRQHRVDVVTMAFGGLPREETRNGVHILRVPCLRKQQGSTQTHEMLSFVLAALPRVARMARSGDYDVIHCHFIVPTGLLAYAATRFAQCPYVLTVHGSDVPGYNPDRFRIEYRFISPLARIIVRHAATTTCPSRFLIETLQCAIGPVPVTHIPNAVCASKYTPQPKKPRIFMAGRLLPLKGFQHVLEALQGVETDFEVHVAGDGPMRAQLEKLAAKLSTKTVFHGRLEPGSPELTDLFETSAIFCLVSEKENAPVSLLEAMQSGAAVVTSNATGCAELIGDAGLTVTPGDAPAIRDALTRLLQSRTVREDLGARAQERIRTAFSFECVGDRYLALLQEAARERGAA